MQASTTTNCWHDQDPRDRRQGAPRPQRSRLLQRQGPRPPGDRLRRRDRCLVARDLEGEPHLPLGQTRRSQLHRPHLRQPLRGRRWRIRADLVALISAPAPRHRRGVMDIAPGLCGAPRPRNARKTSVPSTRLRIISHPHYRPYDVRRIGPRSAPPGRSARTKAATTSQSSSATRASPSRSTRTCSTRRTAQATR